MEDQADEAEGNGSRPSTKVSKHAVLISSDFILHFIPRLIGPAGKESLLTPQASTIPALSPPDAASKGATAGEQCPICQAPDTSSACSVFLLAAA